MLTRSRRPRRDRKEAIPTLAINKGLLTDLTKLDKPAAKRVTEVSDGFDAATPTGLHLEKIVKASNRRFRAIRTDQGWRILVPFELASHPQAHRRRLAIEKSPERPRGRRFRDLRSSADSVPLPYVKQPR